MVALVGAESSEGLESLAVLVLFCDLDVFDSLLLLGDWHGLALDLESGGGGLELLGGGVGEEVSLLWLLLAAGEHDELALVGLQSLDVHIQLFLAGGGSSVIYGDSDGSGVGWSHASGLQLLQSEAAAKANLAGVFASSLRHNWSKGINWSWEDAGGLSLPDLVSLGLLRRLVEVGLDTNSFPVLAEMHVDNHIVMLDHC